jgi:hypothetical protein
MSHMRGLDELKVEKLLSIAESGVDDKAIAAFMLARQRLARQGVSLETLIRPASQWPPSVCRSSAPRLAKILSLTSSDKAGETAAAFLMARRLMLRLGLTFSQVLDLTPVSGTVEDDGGLYPTAEIEILALRKRVRQLQNELADRTAQLRRYESAFNKMVENAWAANVGDTAEFLPAE